MTTDYYTVVTFGKPTMGSTKSFYTSRQDAIRDAQTLEGGTLSSVRVLRCPTKASAVDAAISDDYPVITIIR